MNRSSILMVVGVAAVMLLIGAVAGSVVFPETRTMTSTLTISLTSTQTIQSSGSNSTNIENYVSSPTCPNLSTTGLTIAKESSNGQINLLAFLMKPGTTATICVAYPLESDASLPATISFSGYQILEVNATPVPNQDGQFGYSYSYSPAPEITETATPGILTIPAGYNKSSVIVNYTITASPQAKGFYTLSYYENCPPLIPFSVGYGTSQLNASDFEGFFLASSCTIQSALSDGEIVGYGGMGTVVLSP